MSVLVFRHLYDNNGSAISPFHTGLRAKRRMLYDCWPVCIQSARVAGRGQNGPRALGRDTKQNWSAIANTPIAIFCRVLEQLQQAVALVQHGKKQSVKFDEYDHPLGCVAESLVNT